MISKEISDYFEATEHRKTRDDLVNAVKLVSNPKVAIDCGCGSGSDIAFLRSEGFQVHAFDVEEEAINRCQKRYIKDDGVTLTLASFDTYVYPTASLVVADSSLFFCNENLFGTVWNKIANALISDGVFVGSFLGPEDTMAGPDYKRSDYWPDVMVVGEKQIKLLFEGFKINSFTEHRSSGHATDGKPHQWHIFSVIAQYNP